MARAGLARRILILGLFLLAGNADADRVPRSLLAEEEQSLIRQWEEHSPPSDLAGYLELQGFALRERRRRAEMLRAARSGEMGSSEQTIARRIRALEIELSEHALVDPYQYILDFRDGSNRIEVDPHPALDLVDAYTVSLWLYMEGGARAWETKLYSHSDVNDNKFNVMLEGRHAELLVWSDQDDALHFRCDDELPLREWVHLLVSYSRGNGASFHLNGRSLAYRQTRGGSDYPPLRADTQQELYMGCLDRCIPGNLDEVRVYDRVLDADEIATLARGGSVREGLVSHWPLDEVDGARARNMVEPAAGGRVGSAVRRGLSPPAGLAGAAYGFSGKASMWSRRLERIEAEIDSLELDLLSRTELPSSPAPVIPRVGVPLLIYLPEMRGVHFVLPEREEAIYLPLPQIALPQWRDEMSRRGRRLDDRAWRELARALAVALWDPVAELLEAEAVDSSELWLSLPHDLRSLPFSALVDRRGAYLQESIAFARVGALRELRAQPVVPDGETVLIGNPDFRSPRGHRRELPWSSPEDADGIDRVARCWVGGPLLYGTHKELQQLESLFASRGSSRLEWFDAYVSVLEQRMPGSGVIHLATHGYRLDGECAPRLPRERLEWSGLKLGGSDLLRGDSVEHEDWGNLSAAGLARLDLSATRLIFFSGCETAVISGGSLADAAWLAGARASVGTLSSIDDGLTPVLAEHFYAQWMNGESAAEALRRARERLRQHLLSTRGRVHPSSWAPFVLEGL